MLTKLLDSVRLKRDVEGIMIPAGVPVILPAGSTVLLKQALGDDYTVTTDCGDMVRILGRDADALGRQAPSASTSAAGPVTCDSVLDALRGVYDPELPVNIVDLGLIYSCRVTPHSSGGQDVHIVMTLTAPGCGMGEVLKQDVERKVREMPTVKDARVEITFDPPWSQKMMSEVAQLELGFF